MTDTHHTEVQVVGAGPVGLTLALDLARRGIACRIIEQAPTNQIGTCGRGISLRTQQLFEGLGILEALVPYDEGMPPSGDASHARIYIGPQLYGSDADLIPVTLSFIDINGDHKPDSSLYP